MNLLGGLRETGDLPLFSPKGRTYSPPRRHKLHILRPAASGRSHPFRCASFSHKVSDFVGALLRRWYCLRQPCALRGGCGSCGSLMSNATSHLCCCHWPRSRLYVLLHHQNCCFRFGNNPPPARIKLPPAALFAVMGIACRNTHFLFAKKKQKQGRKDGENEWRFTT